MPSDTLRIPDLCPSASLGGAFDKPSNFHGHIVLFKTPSPSGLASSGPYARILEANGYQSTFVPVLEETYDTARLEDIVRVGPAGRSGDGGKQFDGVIITSKRGAEGWLRAARKVQDSELECPDWNSIPLHTVGQSSIDTLTATSEPSSTRSETSSESSSSGVTGKIDRRLIPSHTDIRARTAKSAETVLPLLLTQLDADSPEARGDFHIGARESGGDGELLGTDKSDGTAGVEAGSRAGPGGRGECSGKRYLFVRGDKSQHTLQSGLRAANHIVDEVEVYRTSPSPDLESAIRDMETAIHAELYPSRARVNAGTEARLQDIGVDAVTDIASTPIKPVWLAFFSPSSAAYVFQHLHPDIQALVRAEPGQQTGGSKERRWVVATSEEGGAKGSEGADRSGRRQRGGGGLRTAAIGETTSRWMCAQGVRVDAVAASPDPAGLVEAIKSMPGAQEIEGKEEWQTRTQEGVVVGDERGT